MAASNDSERPVAGAVFGFTGSVKKTAPVKQKKRASLRRRPEESGEALTRRDLRDTGGNSARRTRRNKRQRGLSDDLHVKKEHLQSFRCLHDLLRVLNDPFAAGSDLSSYVEEIPLLKVRLLRSARIRTGHLDLDNVTTALSFIGNKGLENELLILLEDMTLAQAEFYPERSIAPGAQKDGSDPSREDQ